MEPVDNRCISLRIDRTAHNSDTVKPVVEDELGFLVLGKITAETLALFEAEKAALDYRRPVALLRGPVAAPFSMGRTKRSRCTVLPERDYSPEELSMIFRHELHHLQREDVDTKVFLCLCNALGWFNPLVWIATRKAAEDLERSCDEIVTEQMSETERRAYARLLLDAAAPGRGCTTCLSAAAGTLRYRLKSVMEQRRRALGTLLVMAALFGCVLCFGLVSVSDARGSFPELLLRHTQIESVIDDRDRYTVIHEWDDAALRKALDAVELEHLGGLRHTGTERGGVTFITPDRKYIHLTQRQLIVFDYRKLLPNMTADCYLVRSAVDFDAIRAALHAE